MLGWEKSAFPVQKTADNNAALAKSLVEFVPVSLMCYPI